jgi:hypothetical protein
MWYDYEADMVCQLIEKTSMGIDEAFKVPDTQADVSPSVLIFS